MLTSADLASQYLQEKMRKNDLDALKTKKIWTRGSKFNSKLVLALSFTSYLKVEQDCWRLVRSAEVKAQHQKDNLVQNVRHHNIRSFCEESISNSKQHIHHLTDISTTIYVQNLHCHYCTHFYGRYVILLCPFMLAEEKSSRKEVKRIRTREYLNTG